MGEKLQSQQEPWGGATEYRKGDSGTKFMSRQMGEKPWESVDSVGAGFAGWKLLDSVLLNALSHCCRLNSPLRIGWMATLRPSTSRRESTKQSRTSPRSS